MFVNQPAQPDKSLTVCAPASIANALFPPACFIPPLLLINAKVNIAIFLVVYISRRGEIVEDITIIYAYIGNKVLV